MRLQVINTKQGPLAGWLRAAGYEITNSRPDFIVEVIESGNLPPNEVEISTGNTGLEMKLVSKLKELGLTGFFLDKKEEESIKLSDRKIKVKISNRETLDIERSIYQALCEYLTWRNRRWFNYFLPFVLSFLSFSSPLLAQDSFTFIRLWTSSGPVYAADFANNAVRVNLITGTLTGTSNVNVAQFGGTNVVTGTGASGLGIPRVTVSNDSSLAANQSVNLNQYGGTATTLGSKVSASSVPVVIASDQGGTLSPSTLIVVAKSAANSSVTATLTAVASSFHYITSLRIMHSCSTALTGTNIFDVTTTNLPGSATWSLGNACAIGSTNIDVQMPYNNPIKSSVINTNTTIVCPALGAATFCKIEVTYYTGS